jgi:cell division septation protein DedD
VRAAGTSFGAGARVQPKAEPAAKVNGAARSVPAQPTPDVDTQPDSDWSFYKSAKSDAPDENLKPVAALAPPKIPGSSAKIKSSKLVNASAIPAGAYTLQVAALRRESDALALAAHLQTRKFPAFVASPQADKYYRVQVGPYTDQKSADAARKGLESAGFKAIVKH